MVACRYYAKGKCWNGKFCAFEHVTDSPSTPTHPYPSSNWRNEKSTSPKYLRGSVHKLQPCSYFLNGHCMFGSECKFYHPGEKQNLEYEGTGRDPRSQMLCRDFASGYCARGSKCAFSHYGQQFPALQQTSMGKTREEETQREQSTVLSDGTAQLAHLGFEQKPHVKVRQNDGRRMDYAPGDHYAAAGSGLGSASGLSLNDTHDLREEKGILATNAKPGIPEKPHGTHSEISAPNTLRTIDEPASSRKPRVPGAEIADPASDSISTERVAVAGDQSEETRDKSAWSYGDEEPPADENKNNQEPGQRDEEGTPSTEDEEVFYDAEDGEIRLTMEEASSYIHRWWRYTQA